MTFSAYGDPPNKFYIVFDKMASLVAAMINRIWDHLTNFPLLYLIVLLCATLVFFVLGTARPGFMKLSAACFIVALGVSMYAETEGRKLPLTWLLLLGAVMAIVGAALAFQWGSRNNHLLVVGLLGIFLATGLWLINAIAGSTAIAAAVLSVPLGVLIGAKFIPPDPLKDT
jgi:hypothetical protein